MPTDIADLVSRGEEFAKVLDRAKERVHPRRFEWYRYDSLANLSHLDQLLTGTNRDLVRLAAGDPVLDFGCADGDLAFFLESLGLNVLTFDHVRTNHNGMMGVRALKEELGSKVQIHELDLDNNFEIPEGRFGLALVLGILYHLKNPFYVLETISKRARYCLLSTRVTRYLPDRRTDISKTPVAYLLGETELNADATNFWIFSEAGLRRIVERANWRVLEFRTIGDTQASDPVSLDHDERAFCLLESVYGMGHLDLLEGWHVPEPAGWRWTEKRFRMRLRGMATITLKLYIPPHMIDEFGSITLSAEANGMPLAPETYTEPGNARYCRRLPEGQDPVEVVCTVDRAIPPSSVDSRELGIIVARLDAE
jgi:2-polyprenyl-3-methyl-5-hydroxy-6-metoxy-1,4-benzoquinol methylase